MMTLNEHQKAQLYAGSQFGAEIVNFIDGEVTKQFNVVLQAHVDKMEKYDA